MALVFEGVGQPTPHEDGQAAHGDEDERKARDVGSHGSPFYKLRSASTKTVHAAKNIKNTPIKIRSAICISFLFQNCSGLHRA
jgi:hypothetical protein